MAAIVHRCACGHLDAFHTYNEKKETRPCPVADCRCTDSEPDSPEVIPTWSSGGDPTGQTHPNPVVLEPGTVDGPGLGRYCDCDDCQALYRAEMAGAIR